MSFNGAKVILFIGRDLLVIRRDDKPDIEWPNRLDLPGGGAEAGETPEVCALRETREEVGLILPQSSLVWRRRYVTGARVSWFFAAHLPAVAHRDIVFGDEGQGWQLMPPDVFATHPEAVPHFGDRVRDYLQEAANGQR